MPSVTSHSERGRRHALHVAAIGGAAATGAVLGGGLATATYFARVALTPEARRPDNVRVLALDADTMTLAADHETVVPGRYGLWFDDGAGHARVGRILRYDRQRGEVVRELEGLDRGDPRPGPARWNQYYYWDSPRVSMGLPSRDVAVEGELGPMPAWVLEPEVSNGRWAILVHGRGARREECLRALPVLRRLGYTSLVVSYRNDAAAPPAPDGRYNLGLSEWRDVDAAMQYAVEHGATGIVLAGWSMGGAIVFQTLNRSPLSDLVEAVVMDSPVVDWGDVLTHHARLHHVPPPVAAVGTGLMGRRATRRLVGVHDPVDVARTNWVARAGELEHRILIQASVDDEFVPAGPALQLAAARPDLVTLERWGIARHCKEWNLDPERWERAVAQFLQAPISAAR